MSLPLHGTRLSVLVHEVRSPVAALRAIAEAFVTGEDTQGSDRAELVRLAINACRGLERIAVDALTLSARRETIDPGELVRDVVATARLRGSDVSADVSTGLPAVSGDPVRLRQALDNLVTNALVHSETGSTVVVGAAVSRDGVLLSVSDAGAGIPHAEQERIFMPGERLEASTPGSGLGLAISRAIAEAHGGRLSVVSAPGLGATFTITLPPG